MSRIKSISGNKYSSLTATENYRRGDNGIWWEFRCECGNVKYILKKNVVNGSTTSCGCLIKRPTYIRKRKLYGVGIFTNGNFPATVNGVHTKAYKLWSGMLERCYSKSFQEKQPTYVGCTVSENFKNFQFFAAWCQSQVGFGIKGYHLDKDILSRGVCEPLYSETTCCFVPRAVNNLLTKRQRFRGEYPIGVSNYNGSGKYRASLNIDGKMISEGNFTNVEEAFTWYKHQKEKEIKRKANIYKDILSEKVYDALIKWEVSFDD